MAYERNESSYEGEKLAEVCAFLKQQVRLEVMKACLVYFYDVARIALSVDSALFGAGMFSGSFQYVGPQPMDIGSVQGNSRNHRTSFKGKQKWRGK